MGSWLLKIRLKRASSLDSLSSVKLGVSAAQRPDRTPRLTSASIRRRSAAEVKPPPHIHCIKEFANNSGVDVNTMCKASLQSPWERRILSTF